MNPAHVEVWEDLHTEGVGYYRAFWTEDGSVGCPVIGYCSAGGSHRTVRAVAAEVQRLYPGEPVYRHGRRVV